MNNEVAVSIAMGVLFLVAYSWISLIATVVRGRIILAFEPRRSVPWGIVAVVASFCLFIGSQFVAAVIFGGKPEAEATVEQSRILLLAMAGAISFSTLASIALLSWSERARQDDLGISLDNTLRDLWIGFRAFLLLAPVAFLIQFVFVKLLGAESTHPLIELLKEDTTGTLFGAVTLLAVVVAPISEEFLFRVVLQGWLEKVFAFHFASGPDLDDDVEALVVEGMIENDESHGVLVVEASGAMAWIPVVISAAIFALMHWSHGPDFIALFAFALGLGYIYQRTHRWLPCVVTHAGLNGTTMLMLWAGLE